jgi:hypothetical protein
MGVALWELQKMRSIALFLLTGMMVAATTSSYAQPPKGKAKEQEPVVTDITDRVAATADPRNPKYFKLTGAFGQSYIVLGDDVGLKSATMTTGEKVLTPGMNKETVHNVMRVEMRVTEDGRGIQFVGMVGAQVEFLADGAKKGTPPEVTVIRKANQTIDLDKGVVTIVMGKPLPPLPKVDPKKADPKKK